jgi:hypothetical protein
MTLSQTINKNIMVYNKNKSQIIFYLIYFSGFKLKI